MIFFSKYHGSGNDFILIDDRKKTFPIEKVTELCHRRFGIGADGVILWQDSETYDAKMRIFNSDGKEAGSCGNGLCCLLQFIQDQGFSVSTIELMDGCAQVSVKDDTPFITIQAPKKIQKKEVYLTNTGVEHGVVFVEDIKEIDIDLVGKKLRERHKANINFAQVKEDGIYVRTFEKGVEAETLACGTGACAVAWVAKELYRLNNPISVHFPGGALLIYCQKDEIQFHGSASFVFSGTFQEEKSISSCLSKRFFKKAAREKF